jgi:hypothetical protein
MAHVGKLLSTVGYEFEGTILTRQDLARALPQYGPYNDDGVPPKGSPIAKIYRDASVEFRVASLGGVRLNLGREKLRGVAQRMGLSTGVSGVELISKPLVIDVARKYTETVLRVLESAGEIFSPRASIHLHVGYPHILESLKSAVSFGLAYEGLFYRLAGMGNPYRGSINHSIYARPLSLPLAVPTNRPGHWAILRPERSLEATTLGEFWEVLLSNYGMTTRYHPLRYYGLNFYSVGLLGTLEFRYLNLCLNSKLVNTITKLFMMSAEICGYGTHELFSEDRIDITIPNSIDVYEQAIFRLMGLSCKLDTEVRLDTDDMRVILELIEKTPPVIFTTELVKTHVSQFTVNARDNPLLELTTTQPVDSGHIDIHNIADKEVELCAS